MLAHILKDYGVLLEKTQRTKTQSAKNQNTNLLFDFYVLTGGVPKYVNWLVRRNVKNFHDMLDFMLSANSPFIEEGLNLLIPEFGKEYGTYFSILQLISMGKTARSEIESILGKNIGGYLERLVEDYAVLEKHRSIDGKKASKMQKYKIADNFIHFWFRFVYRNVSAIENGNFEYVKSLVLRDYPTYCGKMLEKYYIERLWITKKFNRIGSYWEKGNQNEIDIVAFNDLHKQCLIVDVKLNPDKINLPSLQKKAEKLLAKYQDYEITWLGLSLQEVDKDFSFDF